MTVADLIAKLKDLDPNTLILEPAEKEGWNEVYLTETFEVVPSRVAGRKRSAQGLGDWDNVEVRERTRAKRRKAVLLY